MPGIVVGEGPKPLRSTVWDVISEASLHEDIITSQHMPYTDCTRGPLEVFRCSGVSEARAILAMHASMTSQLAQSALKTW